jgi:hypothetical protein
MRGRQRARLLFSRYGVSGRKRISRRWLTAEIYVAAQRHEHVVRRGDLLAIEKDVGDRRQPVKLDVVRSVRFEIATVPDLALIERNRIVP